MDGERRHNRGAITRSSVGPSAAEAFTIIAIATILLTRLYLRLTDYPQVGGGDLHIAHALYGGALMMLALLIGWLVLGFGARMVCVVVGGIGFGLFLDEVGKFVTKDNDYFYGPAAEIMYILLVIILVGARVVRDFRPLSARECLASADHASDRLHALQQGVIRLIPDFLRSPRLVALVGWLMVIGALLSAVFGVLGVALGGYLYEDEKLTLKLDSLSVATVILLVSAGLTLAMSLPAMIARRRTESVWPLVWLRNAALVFTLLNALVDFATEGFGALINMSIGLFTLAILSYHLDLAARSAAPLVSVTAPSGTGT